MLWVEQPLALSRGWHQKSLFHSHHPSILGSTTKSLDRGKVGSGSQRIALTDWLKFKKRLVVTWRSKVADWF